MRTEDGYIVYKCLNGDKAAFGLLVDKYKASIYALAYSKLGNFHDAEDVAQEAFIKAYRKLHTLRRWDNFLAWLYAITSNLCKDWVRSRSRRPDREFIADQEPDILDHPSMNSYRDGLICRSLREALASLPESYSQVLTLHYLGGMTRREIARFLGISPRTITQRLSVGRARLKKEMIGMMDETYEQQRLHETFTFRIVEMVKRMRIRPVPRVSWLPWGLSAMTGIILAVLSFTSPVILLNPVRAGSVTPAEEKVELLSYPLDMDETSFVPYSQTDGMLTYTDVHATLDMTSFTRESIGNGQTFQPEQTLLALAAPGATPDTGKKITVSGKVVKDDIPVPNAQVHFCDTNKRIELGITNTGSDGSFQMELPKNWKNLTIIAHHPKYSFGRAKTSQDRTADLVVQLQDPMSITGTVTDQAGKSIQGAEVEISGVHFGRLTGPPPGDYMPGSFIPNTRMKTDANGRFAFTNLPPGLDANINITMAGYARERKYGIQPGKEGISFKLALESRIEGRVIYGETGEPAQGIAVAARPIHPTEGWAEAQTDEKGYYALENLPAGEYDVVLKERIPDWTAAAREYVKVSEAQVVKGMDLKLVKGGFITGRVTYEGTDEPITNYVVGVSDASRPESQASAHSVRTDENGFFRFRAAPGTARIYAYAPGGYEYGRAEKVVDVVEGGMVSDVNFQFPKREPGKLLTVTGTLLSFDGKPVPGAAITDEGRRYKRYGTSDRDGKFTITGLQPGQKISVEVHQQEMQLKGYADIEAQPDAEVEILMERYETTSVSGRVVNKQGNPIPSANIGLNTYDKRRIGHSFGTSAGMADDSGEYTVSGLIIGDEYSISAGAEGHRGRGTSKFTAGANMSPLPDIVLSPSGNFYLEGTLKDTDGNLVVGARIITRSESGREVRTNENGYYRIAGLSFAVEESIQIYHPDYGPHEFWYLPTNQSNDLALTKADGYLKGKVVDPAGNPVDMASVHIDSHRDQQLPGHFNGGTRTDMSGSFSMEHLVTDATEDIYVGKGRTYKVFKDVEMNRDDVVFVLEKSEEPPKPIPPEEKARRKYEGEARRRQEELSGKPAPELEISQWLNGETATLDDLKGRIILLHFWSPRVIRSVEALRLVKKLQKEYGHKGLVFISICEYTTEVDKIRKLIAEKKATHRIAVDKQSPKLSVPGVTADRYAMFASFHTGFVIIGKDRMIHKATWDVRLEREIQELL